MAESVKGVNADWPDELEATRANLRAMADAVELQKDEIERLRAAIRETLYMDDRGHVACQFYPYRNLADIAPVLAEVLKK